MKHNRVFWVTGFLAMAVSSCGGGTSETSSANGQSSTNDGSPIASVSKRGDDSVVATLGSAGGSLELANGARVEIPVGAVQGAKEVVFKEAPPTTVFKDEDVQGDKPVGPIILVTPELSAPEGQHFTISIPFSSVPEGYDASNLYLAYETPSVQQRNFAEDTTITRWDYEQATVHNGRAEVKLNHLPGMRFQFILSREE